MPSVKLVVTIAVVSVVTNVALQHYAARKA